MESKKITSRKELLKQEIDQMESLVKQMEDHAAKGDMNKFPSSSLAATLQNRDTRNHTQSSNSQFVMEGVSGITAADVTTASFDVNSKKRKPRNRSRPSIYNDPTRPPILNIDGSIRKKPGPKTKAEKAAAATATMNDTTKFIPLSTVMKNNASPAAAPKPSIQSPELSDTISEDKGYDDNAMDTE